MNLAEFSNKTIKTKVDFDGVYGAQCVDLFRQYCKDVLSIPHTGGVEGAKDLYLKYDKLPLEQKYFELLPPYYTPSPGDVAIWNETKSNQYGHVAIVLGSIPGVKLLVLEQNGFTQNGTEIKYRLTDNLLGYLRAK